MSLEGDVLFSDREAAEMIEEADPNIAACIKTLLELGEPAEKIEDQLKHKHGSSVVIALLIQTVHHYAAELEATE